MFATKVILKLILICLFIGCLLKVPYFYYEFVKSAAFSIFIIIALIDYKTKFYLSIPISAVGISLFNPLFIKLTINKIEWQLIDKCIIGSLIVWMLIEFTIKASKIYRNKKKSNNKGQMPLFD